MYPSIDLQHTTHSILCLHLPARADVSFHKFRRAQTQGGFRLSDRHLTTIRGINSLCGMTVAYFVLAHTFWKAKLAEVVETDECVHDRQKTSYYTLENTILPTRDLARFWCWVKNPTIGRSFWDASCFDTRTKASRCAASAPLRLVMSTRLIFPGKYFLPWFEWFCRTANGSKDGSIFPFCCILPQEWETELQGAPRVDPNMMIIARTFRVEDVTTPSAPSSPWIHSSRILMDAIFCQQVVNPDDTGHQGSSQEDLGGSKVWLLTERTKKTLHQWIKWWSVYHFFGPEIKLVWRFHCLPVCLTEQTVCVGLKPLETCWFQVALNVLSTCQRQSSKKALCIFFLK